MIPDPVAVSPSMESVAVIDCTPAVSSCTKVFKTPAFAPVKVSWPGSPALGSLLVSWIVPV